MTPRTRSPEPKPCPHKAKHQHGTYQAYKADRCGCPPCLADNNRRTRQRRRLIAYGRWNSGLIDAEPARQHVLALLDAGTNLPQIANADADLSLSQLYELTRGVPSENRPPPKRIRGDIAARILAVDLPATTGTHRRDAFGARRRLQALVAIGWPPAYLADALGSRSTGYRLLNSVHHPQVSMRIHQRVVDLYDELWNRSPHDVCQPRRITEALRLACRKNWPSPLAWDDDTIDDPAAVPDLGTKTETKFEPAAKLPPADEVQWLLDQGETFASVARRFRVTVYAVQNRINPKPSRKKVAA